MVEHATRAHATWSASATARNWHCPGALALSVGAPYQPESIHAARGTATHQVAEKCLTGVDVVPRDFLSDVEHTQEHAITVDDEIVASAQTYVDYVWSRPHDATYMIEQRFDLSSLGGPFDAGGTADAVIYQPRNRTLEVVDLKHGMSVVDVKGNPQLRTYALGAFLASPGLAVDTVTVTIVQPRVQHKDGRIRSETFHVADLIEWTSDLVAVMWRAKNALDQHVACAGNTVLLDEWAGKWLRPGKCKFCPAEGWCPALRRRAHEIAGLWFDDLDQPKLNAPAEQSPEMVARDLASLDLLEDWIKARRAYAHALAEAGTEIPGYRLVDSYGHRKWLANENDVIDAVQLLGFDIDAAYDRKLKSPAALDKAVGKANAKVLTELWHKPVTGTTLVRAETTDRPAAADMAGRYFEEGRN